MTRLTNLAVEVTDLANVLAICLLRLVEISTKLKRETVTPSVRTDSLARIFTRWMLIEIAPRLSRLIAKTIAKSGASMG